MNKKYIDRIKKYCCEDPMLIEGMQTAMNDTSDTIYNCHHRLETHELDGTLKDVPITPKELKEQNLYYNRPADELIILTVSEHRILHTNASFQHPKDPEGNKKMSEIKKVWEENNREKRCLQHRTRKYGVRHNWPNPKDAKYPKEWGQEEIEDYTRRWNTLQKK